MRSSLIVCVYNQEKLIKSCVDALLGQSQDDLEVIVVDDGSTDNTRGILSGISDPRLKVLLNEENHGPAFSRNRGIRESRGEYILFVDSDCIVDRHWAQEMIKPFDLDGAITIGSGRTIDPPSKTYWEMINEGVNFIAPQDGYVKQSHSCNMAVRRSFLINNLFDESLPFSEDFDLCLNCLNKGLKIYYTSQATLVHFHRSTFKSTFRSFFVWGMYNTFVKLKWQKPLFMDYGTYVIAAIVLCLLLKAVHMAWFFIFIYLLGLYGWSVLYGSKSFLKRAIKAPGGIIIKLANSSGNLAGVLVFVLFNLRFFLVKFVGAVENDQKNRDGYQVP